MKRLISLAGMMIFGGVQAQIPAGPLLTVEEVQEMFRNDTVAIKMLLGPVSPGINLGPIINSGKLPNTAMSTRSEGNDQNSLKRCENYPNLQLNLPGVNRKLIYLIGYSPVGTNISLFDPTTAKHLFWGGPLVAVKPQTSHVNLYFAPDIIGGGAYTKLSFNKTTGAGTIQAYYHIGPNTAPDDLIDLQIPGTNTTSPDFDGNINWETKARKVSLKAGTSFRRAPKTDTEPYKYYVEATKKNIPAKSRPGTTAWIYADWKDFVLLAVPSSGVEGFNQPNPGRMMLGWVPKTDLE